MMGGLGNNSGVEQKQCLPSKLNSQGTSLQPQDLLQGFNFFNELQPSTQKALLDIVRKTVTMNRGSVLFREGDFARSCYVLLAGQVSLSSMDGFGPANSKVDSMSRDGSHCSTRASSCSRPSSRDGTEAQMLDNAAEKLALAAPSKAEGYQGSRASGTSIVSLKAGRLFGDYALLQQKPQGFTAMCTQDCELLVFSKSEFDRVLLKDMQKLTLEKLEFLRTYLPGANELPLHKAEALLHCFQKKVLPKGRVLLRQNASEKKCLYLVKEGTVFLSCEDVDMPIMPSEVRTLGTLFRGGVFGSFEERSVQSCTVSCTSASCELFFSSGLNLESLPWAVRKNTRKYLSRTMEWRVNDENPFWSDKKRLAPPEVARPRSSPTNSSGRMSLVAQPTRPRRSSEPSMKLSRRSSFEVEFPSKPSQVRRGSANGALALRALSKKSLGSSSLPSLPRLSLIEACC